MSSTRWPALASNHSAAATWRVARDGRGSCAYATSRVRTCQKAYSASPSIEEWRAGRTSSLRASSRIASVTATGSRPPIAATAPAQNTLPTTAASESIALRSAGSVSRRAAINAPIDSGKGHLGARAERHGSIGLDEQVPVTQQSHELLGVQGIALRSIEDRHLELGGHDGTEKPAHELPGLGIGQRCEIDPVDVRQARGEVGMALEQLRAGRGHEKQGHPHGPVSEVLEEGEHGVVGPMDVLEHQDRRVGLGDGLEKRPPGGEELLALGARAGIDANERPKALAQPIAVGPGRDGVIDLGRGDLRIVGLEDPGLGLDDLAQRPECDSIAVREAAALAPGRGRALWLGRGPEARPRSDSCRCRARRRR